MNETLIPLEALSEAAFVIGADCRVVACNSRAVELLRAESPERVLGRNAADLPNDHDLSAEFPTYLRERLQAVPFMVLQSRLTRDDGTFFLAESTLHRLPEARYLVIIRDITASAEALRRLEAANERLRATIRDRMEFVSNVSHELRTPLTSMSYALTNMTRGVCGALPAKALDYLGRLQVDVKRLLTTVNDILDLRQMENGTLTLRKSAVPLRRLVGEVVEALAIQAETKHQTLTLEPGEREVYSEADRHKIERVCFNILSNAIKYTPEGGAIHATVRAEGDRAVIEVDDNGIGIPPEALPKVSQRYFRVGDQVAGTGLGLSIVREILELHGGALSIQSPVPGTERGTRVTASLPACAAPLLIVVSGDESFIRPLTEQAEAVGLAVRADREAIDVPKGCEGLSPARFVIDGSLPESCLSDLVCQIRGDARLGRLPILLLAPEVEPVRRAEYARMRVDVRPWPLAPASLRALLREQ